MRAILIAAALLAGATPVIAAPGTGMPAAVVPDAAAFARDRQAILAQAGQYKVRFNFNETVSFRAGYEPIATHTSGGNEIVRVIEDSGDRISLQHILVMEHDGQSVVIKHWRQDWVYQPSSVLTYAGPNRWVVSAVPAAERTGAWSQTVWQTDDSPRYGGVGRWSYDNGLTEWTSAPTWRPLARRDAVRDPVYDRYLGVNRHALTPFGWVHIQDNLKMAAGEGDAADAVAIVQEDVVNTYRTDTGYNPGPGDAYWAATKDYWAVVRAAWDEVITTHGGIGLEEEPQTGAITGTALMGLASQIVDGLKTSDAAAAEARQIILEDATAP
ncbi:MAG: hypothetical protein Q8S03_10805 [Brevundimonas sp.]|uniref:DUF6607 family protein n=1 Tax=Brevundimonas sp. TaxID=1871086 RepID=UPI0027364477|nr:DUF6607 family protein [Brevundimonas sp.]MDP3405171.1 hypothetical protein [Brevundimonas sp.]